MQSLNYEQQQKLFNYFAEAHEVFLLEDDFRFIDNLLCSQNSSKPFVKRPLLSSAQKRTNEHRYCRNCNNEDVHFVDTVCGADVYSCTNCNYWSFFVDSNDA